MCVMAARDVPCRSLLLLLLLLHLLHPLLTLCNLRFDLRLVCLHLSELVC